MVVPEHSNTIAAATQDTVAAVDLGSNSFHMIVANLDEMGTLSVIDKVRETVRLRSGLTEDKCLTEEAQQRALQCLRVFNQRLRMLPKSAVRVVGTNTLRNVKDGGAFLEKAEEALGYPIGIISGQEEARLIYLGVAHGRAASNKPRLVIDIGGGSTELIIGQGKESQTRESLEMGSVSMTQLFFSDGIITTERMQEAITHAKLKLHPVVDQFQARLWDHAVGCSGTIKAIRNISHGTGWDSEGLGLQALYQMRDALVLAAQAEVIDLPELAEDRKEILAGGLAVLIACFEALQIKTMSVSEQSLREGVLYDLVNRITNHDTREVTVHSMMKKWSVDTQHALQVADLAGWLSAEVEWQLSPLSRALLVWAAKLHEIGLQVAHSKHYEHGAYILKYADLPGFSRKEQLMVSTLVLNQRRRFDKDSLEKIRKKDKEKTIRLTVLLRLAVLLHRGRTGAQVPNFQMKAQKRKIKLQFPANWLQEHPLTRADLQREKKILGKIDIQLKFL